jgi:hypothetical protein
MGHDLLHGITSQARTPPARARTSARRSRLAATGRAAPVAGCFAFAVLKVAVFNPTFRWTAAS